MTLKLGTRKSLLAWAQSSWVAREVERLNPGTRVELVGIETRGDKILDVPLQSVQGKEFFVAELDDALRSHAVDFTVHSMKDLSLDRPPEFKLAAIPIRENPRDVILFGPGVEEKLRHEKVLRIGTSSPRRLENIPAFLEKALPRHSTCGPNGKLVEIRGNVNTRLSRVHELASSERHLDGVVLAFAGIIRLWADEKGRAELEKLLKGVRWMVLPVGPNPAAPAQGALAIECRSDNADVARTLSRLHHEETAAEVSAERALLEAWGGGCHQKFGATAIRHAEMGQLLYIRGKKPDQTFVDELRWAAPIRNPGKKISAWDGTKWRARAGGASDTSDAVPSLDGKSVFVAHSRAVPENWTDALQRCRVWTSGTPSWFRLAERGIWVEGCAEGLGYDSIDSTLQEKVLRLGKTEDRIVLTHDSATGWTTEKVIRTYSVPEAVSEEAAKELRQATDIYWSSGSQYEALEKNASPTARHACGPGKTASQLRERGIEPDVFPSAEEWRKWLV